MPEIAVLKRHKHLAERCVKAIDDGLKFVCLVIPGDAPRGQRIRMVREYRGRQPMGEIVSWKDDPPGTIAYFEAIEVLAFLAHVATLEGNHD